jgi:four helix bundle protein
MPFLAYDLSLQLIRALVQPTAAVRRYSAKEAAQLDDAANSVVRNLAEAGGRAGRDRLHHFAIAYGSLREVRAVLDLAAAKGWLGDEAAAQALAHRLGGMLYRLAGR